MAGRVEAVPGPGTGVADYLVQDGSRITIGLPSESNHKAVSYFLRRAPLAALLFQRAIPVLHACAVAVRDGAVVIAGGSSVGKSTLLAGLLARGYRMIADDLTPIEVTPDDRLLVHPTDAELTLWQDALTVLDLKIESRALQPGQFRVQIPTEQCAPHPLPLQAVYILSGHNKPEIEITPIEGKKCFNLIGKQMYTNRIADALLDRMTSFKLATAITRELPVRHLRRSRNWCLDQLVERLEQDLS